MDAESVTNVLNTLNNKNGMKEMTTKQNQLAANTNY